MRIVIHGGQPKTGTTSIQETLYANAGGLLSAGYYYPIAQERRHNQKWLLPSLVSREHWGRGVARGGDQQETLNHEIFARMVPAMREEIAAASPHTMILSAENIYNFERDDHAAFRSFLTAFSPDQQIICYVRSPSSQYLSKIQQGFKSHANMAKPGSYKTKIHGRYKTMRKAYDGRVTFCAFQPSALAGGDVVRDFLEQIGLESAIIDGMEKVRSNVSVSAEGMVLMQRYHRQFPAEDQGRFSPRGEAFLAALERAENGLPVTRPRLLPAVKRLVDHANRDDLLAIRDQIGLVFDDVDYAALEANEAPERIVTRDAGEIVAYDAAVLGELGLRVIKELSIAAARREGKRTSPTRDASRKGKPKKKPAPDAAGGSGDRKEKKAKKADGPARATKPPEAGG
jgi:hypothetical protein